MNQGLECIILQKNNFPDTFDQFMSVVWAIQKQDMYLNDRRPNYNKTKSTKLKNLFGVDF